MQRTPGQPPAESAFHGGTISGSSVATTGENAGGGNMLTIGQLIISGLGLLTALLGAGGLFLIGLVNVFSGAQGLEESIPVFGMGWVNLLIVLLAIPSVI